MVTRSLFFRSAPTSSDQGKPFPVSVLMFPSAEGVRAAPDSMCICFLRTKSDRASGSRGLPCCGSGMKLETQVCYFSSWEGGFAPASLLARRHGHLSCLVQDMAAIRTHVCLCSLSFRVCLPFTLKETGPLGLAALMGTSSHETSSHPLDSQGPGIRTPPCLLGR